MTFINQASYWFNDALFTVLLKLSTVEHCRILRANNDLCTSGLQFSLLDAPEPEKAHTDLCDEPVGALEAGLDALRRLGGVLDGALQQVDRELAVRLCRDPTTERVVHLFLRADLKQTQVSREAHAVPDIQQFSIWRNHIRSYVSKSKAEHPGSVCRQCHPISIETFSSEQEKTGKKEKVKKGEEREREKKKERKKGTIHTGAGE